MTCNQCGAAVPAGAAFCPQCGVQLRAVSRATAMVPQPGAARIQAGGAQGAAHDTPEEELWAGAYSPKAMAGSFIGATLVMIVAVVAGSLVPPLGWLVGLGVGVLLFAYLGWSLLYRRMAVRYRLTTQRLLRQMGIMNQTDDRILAVEIDDVTVRQGFFERMFDVGTIILNTKDTQTPVVTMLGIESPRQVADLIDETRRTERNRRAVYTLDA
jgi:membrane protein YdbS with pleckstrin-like domain